MAELNKRRIEIVAFERERVVKRAPEDVGQDAILSHVFERERVAGRPVAMRCRVCQLDAEWLTTAQAARLAQVKDSTVRHWLATGKAHGIRTAGGRHRVCRNSLFAAAQDAILCHALQEAPNDETP